MGKAQAREDKHVLAKDMTTEQLLALPVREFDEIVKVDTFLTIRAYDELDKSHPYYTILYVCPRCGDAMARRDGDSRNDGAEIEGVGPAETQAHWIEKHRFDVAQARRLAQGGNPDGGANLVDIGNGMVRSTMICFHCGMELIKTEFKNDETLTARLKRFGVKGASVVMSHVERFHRAPN